MQRLVCWTTSLRAWQPKDGEFGVLVARSRLPSASSPPPPLQGTRLESVLEELMTRVPSEWRPRQWPHDLTDARCDGEPLSAAEVDAALARYLGVRLMGSWVSYQGEGLLSVVASLVSSYALTMLALRRTSEGPIRTGHLISAIRAADWLQLHLLDREQWASWCREFEDAEGSRRLLSLVTAAEDVWGPLSRSAPPAR